MVRTSLISFVLFLVIIILPFTNALSLPFKTGYSSYGMNHTLADKVLQNAYYWCPSCFEGVDLFIFSNSDCVGYYGGYCNRAKYEFKGSYTRVTIGNMDSLGYDDLLWLMKHELVHNVQYLNNPYRLGFSQDEESLADSLAWSDSFSPFIKP